jgi:hypothetical protein
MKSKKVKILAITVIALGLLIAGGILGIRAVSAEGSNGYPPIVKKIAEKFNLKTGEVNQVFEENRQEKEAEQGTKIMENLDKTVKDGKITEEQKKAILDKQAEIKTKREELKNLTPEERQKTMKNLRDELRKWAEENGIDRSLIFMGKQRGPKGNGRMLGS